MKVRDRLRPKYGYMYPLGFLKRKSSARRSVLRSSPIRPFGHPSSDPKWTERFLSEILREHNCWQKV